MKTRSQARRTQSHGQVGASAAAAVNTNHDGMRTSSRSVTTDITSRKTLSKKTHSRKTSSKKTHSKKTSSKKSPSNKAIVKKTNRAIKKSTKNAFRTKSAKLRKVVEKELKVTELPGEVAAIKPNADETLIGRRLFLGWPVEEEGEIRWYSCRVVKYHKATGEHTVVYPYGDEEFTVEDVSLSDGSRMWHLAKHDDAMTGEGSEMLVGRIVVVNKEPHDTREKRLAKTALVLTLKESSRALPRRSTLFMPTRPLDQHCIVLWLYPDLNIRAGPGSYDGEAYDVQQLRISECTYSTAWDYMNIDLVLS